MNEEQSQPQRRHRRPLPLATIAATASLLAISAAGGIALLRHHRTSTNGFDGTATAEHHSIRRREQQDAAESMSDLPTPDSDFGDMTNWNIPILISDPPEIMISDPPETGGNTPPEIVSNPMVPCPDGQDSIPNTYCGRGPNRADCGTDEFCHVEAADSFAVCCPSVNDNDSKGDNPDVVINLLSCCDPERGPGGCPDANGSFDNCWDEGGFCCSDGNWYAHNGDGGNNCKDHQLEDSQACPILIMGDGEIPILMPGDGETMATVGGWPDPTEPPRIATLPAYTSTTEATTTPDEFLGDDTTTTERPIYSPHTDPVEFATTEETIMAATSSTTTSSGKPYWYPFEGEDGIQTCIYNSNYPSGYSKSPKMLFKNEKMCCRNFNVCQSDNVGPTAAAATVPATTALVKPNHWYPMEVEATLLNNEAVTVQCLFGNDYPDVYYTEPEMRVFTLFNTKVECCEAFRGCQSTQDEPEPEPLHEYWYPGFENDTGAPSCLFGNDYPEEFMDGMDVPEEDAMQLLFKEEGECCEWFPAACVNGDVGTVTTTTSATEAVDAISTTTDATDLDSTTTTTPLDPCTNCQWHESTRAYQTCTNSPSEYPASWDESVAARAYFFFHTAEECCATRFPQGSDGGSGGGGECSVQDVLASDGKGTSEFTVLDDLGGMENFDNETLVLPFDLGTPPQWERDTVVSFSGTHALTNIPAIGLGATSELTLKINVAARSTFQCYAKIDTSMPYDNFSLSINGQQRNTYYQREIRMIITQSLDVGDNTIVFKVTNNNVELPQAMLGGNRVVEVFGTGRVW
eukprot:CAMPEP_0172304948 /NCGR_PEP_ID=MMETSP1058-20130122/6286_1 /TAXON_ID=83371 /ORGANISM="Detonula confervacea, Strain CCMP 353" /LENGTH=800 /DNA_ID=CAMNT_0013016355 /DNA_START=32 /DNA_END=2431 /DNA_ORIENTATION=-